MKDDRFKLQVGSGRWQVEGRRAPIVKILVVSRQSPASSRGGSWPARFCIRFLRDGQDRPLRYSFHMQRKTIRGRPTTKSIAFGPPPYLPLANRDDRLRNSLTYQIRSARSAPKLEAGDRWLVAKLPAPLNLPPATLNLQLKKRLGINQTALCNIKLS